MQKKQLRRTHVRTSGWAPALRAPSRCACTNCLYTNYFPHFPHLQYKDRLKTDSFYQDQRVGAGVEGAIEVSVHKLLSYKMFSTFSTFAILRPTKIASKLTLNIRTTSSHPNQHRKGSWAPALRAPPRWACTNCFPPKDFPHS